MIYLTLEELLLVAEETLGNVEMRDLGLLESAGARPQASAFGDDAYPGLLDKAAALVHSIARNHALVDGNKRLALAGLMAFLGMNGARLTLTNDEAYDFIVEIASGKLDDIADIVDVLKRRVEPWIAD
ncbi:MAG: type II toxin-antitoxin system death-on-curing family toxin [Nocardioides sp.]